MHKHIGEKIMTLSSVVCWVGIIASIISGIAYMILFPDLILIGFLIMAAGGISSWINSICLYGFGQLIDNSDTIALACKKNDLLSAVEKKNETPSASVGERPHFSENVQQNGPQSTQAAPVIKKVHLPENVRQITSLNETCIGTCAFCKSIKTSITHYKIKTNIGTMYRYICSDCVTEINNSIQK